MLNEVYFPEKAHRNNTLGDAITRYRERILPHLAKNSIRVRKRTLAFWEQNLGDTTLNNITPAMVDDYLYLLDQKGLATKGLCKIKLSQLTWYPPDNHLLEVPTWN